MNQTTNAVINAAFLALMPMYRRTKQTTSTENKSVVMVIGFKLKIN